MSDFTFPIPAHQAQLDGLENALGQNATDLARVLQPLGAQMIGAIEQNAKDLTSVVGRVKRPVGKALKQNQSDLASVIGPVADQVDGAIALNRSQLATVQAAAGPEPVQLVSPPQPTQPAPVLVWWASCINGLNDPNNSLSLPPGESPPAPGPGQTWVGPFATYSDMAAAPCPAADTTRSIGIGPLPPTPTPTTLPPIGIGPLPPQPAPVVWRQWWNYCTGQMVIIPDGPTPDGSVAGTYHDWLNAPFVASPTGWFSNTTAPGPNFFDTGAIDHAYLGRFWAITGMTCPPNVPLVTPPAPAPAPTPTPTPTPPTCPPAPPCPVPPEPAPETDPGPEPDTTCIFPPGLEGGIPSPGSADWCRLQSKIKEWFAAIGQAVIDTFLGTDSRPILDIGDVWPKTASGASFAAVTGLLPRLLIVGLRQVSDRAADWLQGVIDCWRQFAGLQTECSAQAFLGIAVLRAALRILKDCRLGLSWPLDMLVTLRAELVQVERAVDYIMESLCPSIIPDAGAARHAYIQGQIDRDVYTCWAAAHGVSVDVWEPVLVAASERVGAHGLIEWARRNDVPTPDVDALLRNHGWYRAEDREYVQYLYDRIPPLETWLRWERADVLDEEYVKRYDLTAGFDDEFWPLAQKAVLALGGNREWARRSYAAQLIQPSVGQMRTLLYRLRPGKEGVTLPFTADDFERLAQAADYSPPAVQWLSQTAYRVLGEGQLQQLVNWHQIDWTRWQSGMKDIGYDEETTHVLYLYAQQVYARDRASAAHGWTLPVVAQAVRQAVVTSAQAQALLSGQGYTDDEIATAIQREQTAYLGRIADRAAQRARLRVQAATMLAYSAGTVDAAGAASTLVSVGYSVASAAAVLAAADLTVSAQIATKATSALKRAYMKGEVSLAQAQTLLATAGITDARSAGLLQEWAIEFAAQRPTLATAQILRLVGEGLLPAAIAQQRLVNLGWAGADLMLLEQEVSLKIAKQQAAAAQKAMKRQPESKLRKWFLQRIIDADYVEARLRLYGYDEVTIGFLIESWTEERAKKEAVKPAPGPDHPLPPAKQVSIHTLRAWFLDRLMDEEDVRQRLSDYGYSADTISTYLAEWAAQRAYREAKKTAPAPL